MAAMLAWAIHWRLVRRARRRRAAVGRPTSLTRHYLSETIYGNLFLLLIGGPIVGLWSTRCCARRPRTAAAERAAAAAAERARLARAVHDGVLQVLALVQRRGPELGPEGAELGRLAGEQEPALRALIRQQDAVDADARAWSTWSASCRRSSAGPASRSRRRRAACSSSRPWPTRSWPWCRRAWTTSWPTSGPTAPAWVLLEARPTRSW